jgi:uncharacterized protein YbjT (DUF2867 family)
MSPPVHVIGASGRSGEALCRALAMAGRSFVPVVRNPARWAASGLAVPPRVADVADAAALKAALSDATRVVCTAHARNAAAVVAAAPPVTQFVFLGSTRKFTRWPDAHASGVLAGETAFLAAGRPGAMLHPTMIYGAQGEDNVRRLAALMRWLPVVPLPAGGTALVQPIHQSDLTRAILACLAMGWHAPETMVVAGPAPVTYADFVRAIAAADLQPPPRILPVPAALLMAGSLLTLVPGLPRIRAVEIRRLLEHKAFDIGVMRSRLGIEPISLSQGLRQTFAKQEDKEELLF